MNIYEMATIRKILDVGILLDYFLLTQLDYRIYSSDLINDNLRIYEFTL